MKTKVVYGGVVVGRKNIIKIISAIEHTGLDINYSSVAKKAKLPISTVWDAWRKFEKDNKIEIIIRLG